MIITKTMGERGGVWIQCEAKGCEATRSGIVVPGKPHDGDVDKMRWMPTEGWSKRFVGNVEKDYCPLHADMGGPVHPNETCGDFVIRYGRCCVSRSRKHSREHWVAQSAVLRVLREMSVADAADIEKRVYVLVARAVDRTYKVFFGENAVVNEDPDSVRLSLEIRKAYAPRTKLPSDAAFVEQLRATHGGKDAREILREATFAALAAFAEENREREYAAKSAAWARGRLAMVQADARAAVDFDARVAALRDEYEAAFAAGLRRDVRGMRRYDGAVADTMVELARTPEYHPLDAVVAGRGEDGSVA